VFFLLVVGLKENARNICMVCWPVAGLFVGAVVGVALIIGVVAGVSEVVRQFVRHG
jgi:hypothetical protein